MSRTKQLTFFTAGYPQVSVVFPFIVVSPAYFAGEIQLGGLMQTASAFDSVQSALSFFITVYRQLAEWRAVIQRLDGLQPRSQAARAAAATPPRDRGRAATRQGRRSRSTTCRCELPDGSAAGRRRRHRDRAPATACWSPGLGRRQVDAVPRHRRHLAVRHGPRRGAEGRAADDAAAAALLPGRHAGRGGDLSGRGRRLQRRADRRGAARRRLPALVERLDEEAHWNRMLSLGEQQRLGIARALLQEPD